MDLRDTVVTEISTTYQLTVRQALAELDRCGRGYLVVEHDGQFVGVITDGDLRRAILAGADMDSEAPVNIRPATVAPGDDPALLLSQFDVVPVVKDGKLVDVIERERRKANIPAVIMAGGRGTRLKPFTDVLPKPLIPVDGVPMIDHIMAQFTDVTVIAGYKAEILKAYLGDRCTVVVEDEPMGTAGGLSLLQMDTDYIMTNCDVMVMTDYARALEYHLDAGNDITIIGATVRAALPYGTCVTDNGKLRELREKPEYDYIANTGVYIISPTVQPRGKMDMPELIEQVSAGVYPVSEDCWIDVGHWAKYKKTVDNWPE
jgi:choline kinase